MLAFRTITRITPLLALAGLAALVGCEVGGTGDADLSSARGAVLGWTSALEDGDTGELQNIAAPNYAYDGAELATGNNDGASGGAGDAMPYAPGWMGGGGQTTTQLLDLTETSATTAIARVQVQYVGTMGYGYGGIGMDDSTTDNTGTNSDTGAPDSGSDSPPSSGDGSNGSSGGAGDEGDDPGFVSPGFGGPTRPAINGSTSSSAGASSRGVAARQMWGNEQISFTAILVLGLENISGAWFVVSQRQEMSITLMGNGAEAPVIDELTLSPVTAQPGSDVTLAGTVRNATESYVNVRVGWQYAALELSGGSFSGDIRAPRVAGDYVVEVEAINSSGSGAYGAATKSVELSLEGEPVPSYELSSDVPVDAAIEAALREYIDGVRDPDWNNWNSPFAAALEVVADDYSYDGQDASGAGWASGIEVAESTDLTATITQADLADGVWTVMLQTVQESSYDTGYGYGYGGGVMDGGGVAVPDAPPPATDPGAPSDTVNAQTRQLYAWGDVVSHANVLFEFTQQGDEWLITAVRIADGWSASDSASLPTMDITVNGGQGTALPGCTEFAVDGELTGWQGDGSIDANINYASYDYRELVGPNFSATLTAPGVMGRWVARVTAYLYSDDGRGITLYKSAEITVTEASDACANPWYGDDGSGGTTGDPGSTDGREPMPNEPVEPMMD